MHDFPYCGNQKWVQNHSVISITNTSMSQLPFLDHTDIDRSTEKKKIYSSLRIKINYVASIRKFEYDHFTHLQRKLLI